VRALLAMQFKSRWWVYVVGILGVLCTNTCEVLVPKFVQYFVDFISKKQTPSFLQSISSQKEIGFYLLGGFFLSIFFLALSRVVWRLFLGQETHYSTASMKSAIFDRARFLPLGRISTDLNPGHLMNISASDVTRARYVFGWLLVGSADVLFLGLLSIGFMANLDFSLSLICLFYIPFLPFALKNLAKLEEKYHKESQQELSILNDASNQSVASIRLQKLTGSYSYWQKHLALLSESFRSKKLKVIIVSLKLFLINSALPLLSFTMLMIFGLPKVISGQMSIGEFIAFQSYLLIIQAPLMELGTIISEWQQCLGSLKRICSVLQEKEVNNLRKNGDKVKSSPAVYSVKNLSFSYPGTQQKILSNLSFEVKKGQRLGIHGPIGSGKSTLLQIMSGHILNSSGEIYFNGNNPQNLDHRDFKKHMRSVPQKSFLFADTLRNNLSMGTSYSDQELWRVLDIVEIKSEVEKMHNKLDTLLGEWGVNLSGGQKQRVCLARALLNAPKVLLLDDCLSAVDTLKEEQILNNLEKHFKNETLIWVAHRKSTLRLCSEFLELSA